MLDEKPQEEQQETYYDDVRADIETAVYTYTSLEEMDSALYNKSVQKSISKAKENCIFIMCRGLEILRDGYEKEDDE